MSGGIGRREFVSAGLGLGLGNRFARGARPEASCILLMLVGGPSQLDTWDMKPEAPAEIRGPFRPIRTNVPGIEISEIFPRMARHADKYALVRSVHHEAAPVHDTGHQLLQTGRVFPPGFEYPHAGCVLSKLQGPRRGMPAHVLLPKPIGSTGAGLPHGQTAGFLGRGYDPVVPGADPRFDAAELERYGGSRFGQNCLRARRLVEAGVRFVTVNMFDTVFDQITWDIHGSEPFTPIGSYRDEIGPAFDSAYTSLLEDLGSRGLLDQTLVIAAGEFGRSPKLNAVGGRDHWPQCWTVVFAGGGVRGGQVIGASDRTGTEPVARPVTPAEITATMYHALGIDPRTALPDEHGRPVPLLPPGTEPIRELFG